jgi:hypothetical protein
MIRFFFCVCCVWALSLAFLLPMYFTEAANRLAKRSSEPPPGAMFTFQLTKTASRGTEREHDGDRSACFR